MITGCNVLENEKGGLFKNFGIDFQSFGVGAKLYFISKKKQDYKMRHLGLAAPWHGVS